MCRDEVRQILGQPSSAEAAHEQWGIQWPDRDFFFNNGFQVTYDSEFKAVHIEACGEPDYTVTFDGIPVRDSPPQEVIDAIQKHAEVDDQYSEHPTCLWFPEIRLNLYREHSDEDKFDTIGISPPESKGDGAAG